MIKYKRIPFETIVNARDLGGFATKDGRITRYGAVLRTDCPIGASEKDKEFLKKYNVTLSIDLRGKDETISTPSGMKDLDWHTYIHCPITEDHSIIRSGEDGKEEKVCMKAGDSVHFGKGTQRGLVNTGCVSSEMMTIMIKPQA